ncbi:MAG: thioredoxin family protein [Rhodothermales bacterium]|nr:thioredoxin family protein [Rhodothermales bacterium]MBO6781597.1 thioredoxin family protein [Rhodothermales bacterium]
MIDTDLIVPVSMSEAYDLTRKGMTTEQLLAEWQQLAEAPLRGLDREERRYRFYVRYNWERFNRVTESFELPESFQALMRLQGAQTWLFLTEHWCADAAYSLPVVLAAAEAAPSAEVRFLLRDDNLSVMERYLTKKARSIPVLAVFDAQGNEILRWGSKPLALDVHRKELQASGADGPTVSAATIKWYEGEGWLEVARELEERFLAVSG